MGTSKTTALYKNLGRFWRLPWCSRGRLRLQNPGPAQKNSTSPLPRQPGSPQIWPPQAGLYLCCKATFFWRCYDKNGTTKRQTPYLDVLWGLSLYLLFLLLLLFRQTSLHSFLFICLCSRTCSSFVSETENWKSFLRIWKKKKKERGSKMWMGWMTSTYSQIRTDENQHGWT